MKHFRPRTLLLVFLCAMFFVSFGLLVGCSNDKDSDKNVCTITYSTSGTAVGQSTVKKGETIGLLPFTDKQGYSFSGWFYDKELTERVYSEDTVDGDLTLYAGFEEQSVDSVLPEYTELSVICDDVNYGVTFASNEKIDERNLGSFITVTSLYGSLPKISVSAIDAGKYELNPIGGYKNGGLYKIEIADDRVGFVGLKDDSDDVDESVKTLYLSIEASDEEIVLTKDGVFEMSRSAVEFSPTDEKFVASKEIYEKMPLSDNFIIRVTDGTEEGGEYIKVTGVEAVDDKYVFSFAACDDVDDVYSDFDVNIGGAVVANEMTKPENISETEKKLAAVEKELYRSKGTEAITQMLASSLNASPTLRELTSSGDNSYRDKITDVKGKTFTVKGLLDDLEIKVSLGTAKNGNFNGIGISPFDDTRWTMLAITFNYETEIKNKVRLEATITLTEYVYIGLAASANKSSGDFKAEITPYSQTDLQFKILVCSMKGKDEESKDDDNKKEEKKDISVEIENLTNGSGDSSNIIEDVREMLSNKGDAIELCSVPMFSASYSVAGVLSINFDLNFVIKVSFAAGVKIDATLLEATTIGVTGNYKTRTVDCYRRAANGSDRYIFDFYAYGYLGLKAGLEGELTVSFLGLKAAFRAGVGIEVGAYADLYGYLHYHAEEKRVFKDVDTNGRHFQTLEGGMYFESGIYLELKAFVGVGKKEYGIGKEFKFSLLEAGDKYLYVEAVENDDLTIIFNENDSKSVSIEGLIPVEGEYMDITTGEKEKRVIPSKNIRIISDSNLFSVDNDNNKLIANMDKISPRLYYGVPSGTISVYYKGPNILFSSKYLAEDIPSLKGFKELCKVTVVYLPDGVKLDEGTDLGKEVTVTYKVRTPESDAVVKTEKVVSGQYYKGSVPFEIAEYCHANGLLAEIDGKAVTYNGYTSGKHLVTEDTTFVFQTVAAQRFIAVQYKTQEDFSSGSDTWTVDIMAIGYNETPGFLKEQEYTPKNIYREYYVVTPDGEKAVMGNEYLAKYDSRMRGTYGYETGKVLDTFGGTSEKINEVFGQIKTGTGEFSKYSEFFTFTIKTEYITGVHKVYFYAPDGTCGQENVKYGETYKVPDYWINNINQSTSERLSGWDTDCDGKADILPNQQFVVTDDMILRPVMTGVGYTLTVIDFDGTTTQYVIDAGKEIPSNVLDVINGNPGEKAAPDDKSFYSENYRTIITSDFVEGNDGYVYFKGVSWRYHADITVMPACDVIITGVEGELYRYVTLTDDSDDGGYFSYKDDNGVTVKSKTVSIAVRDGGTVGTSKDFEQKELKYCPPEGVSYYTSFYTDENGESLDFYTTKITEGKTYLHSGLARYDGLYIVSFEYLVYFENKTTCERKHYLYRVTEAKAEEACKAYDEEYDYYVSQKYRGSIGDETFVYSTYANGLFDMKAVRTVDGYGITYVYYKVCVSKEYRMYKVSLDFDDPERENYDFEVKYGRILTTISGLTKKKTEGTTIIATYVLAGWDIDGDGIADVLPGEDICVKDNVTLKAIWKERTDSL